MAAPLLDLAGTKAKALVDRTEVKDHLDIDAALQAGVPLPDVLGAFAVLFPGVSPMIVVRSLGYLDDPGLPSLPDAVRRRLEREIARLRTITPMLTRYPSISAAAGAVSDRA